jgi:hypothetical protein
MEASMSTRLSEPRGKRPEKGDVATRKVSYAAAGLMAFLIVSAGVLYAVFAAVVPADRTPAFREFPSPKLEADPTAELRALQDKQRKALSSYRWMDATRTLIGIPVERAMAIIAARGDQAYAPIAAKPGARP